MAFQWEQKDALFIPSRDVIADSIETVVGGENLDGLVAIGGCDKNMPGCMIAIANSDVPSVFVYGGTIAPGKLHGESIDLVSVFEGVGQLNSGQIDEEELRELNVMHVQAQVHVVECIQRTQCHQRLKQWG